MPKRLEDEAAAAPWVVHLGEAAALDESLAGVKSATLARASAAGLPVLPGSVLTTRACDEIVRAGGTAAMPPELAAALREAWNALGGPSAAPLVVRSSSTIEDTGRSSMAGMFVSVLDVVSWVGLLRAVERVIASSRTISLDDASAAPPAPMAVLIQPQLVSPTGGVLFGVDPVTGARNTIVVASARGGPQAITAGEGEGARYRLSRRGRVRAAEVTLPEAGLTGRQRRALARLAARTARAFGGPQDVEWAHDGDGRLWLLQSRPVTAVAAEAVGPVLGPGTLGETFPEPLSALEEDLWVEPLREALAGALVMAGSMSRRRVERSPVVTTVGGRVVADLSLVGGAPQRRRALRWLDPRPRARRLRASWRVGRLRTTLPEDATTVLAGADAALEAVPPPVGLGDDELLALLRRGRTMLRSLHAYEILMGMLLPPDATATTAASQALRALWVARAGGMSDAEIVARYPEVLALTAPRIGGTALPPGGSPPPGDGPKSAEIELASIREALRLRVRWVQELQARVAAEAGARLVLAGAIPARGAVRTLRLEELDPALRARAVPDRVRGRAAAPVAPPLPAAFRLTRHGGIVPVSANGRRDGDGHGAGGGRGVGRVHGGPGEPMPGEVLVVRTLAPELAPRLARVSGIVSETGSVLSHLAILAREMGVPTVVGVADATARFAPGALLVVDGTTGEVRKLDEDGAGGTP